MPKAASSAGTAKRACDQCNYRRIKCDRALICDRCTLSKLACTYDKPTKPRGGKRIKELQQLGIPQDEQSDDYLDAASWDHSDASANRDSRDTEGSIFEGPYSRPQRTSMSAHAFQKTTGDQATSGQTDYLSPSIASNRFSSNVRDSGSSILQAMPAFSESPVPSSSFSGSGLLSHFDNDSAHFPNTILHAPSDFESTRNRLENNDMANFFPSSVPPVAFSADNFLTGLYDNLQPQPQQGTDFSFLESWPFWLAATAANSPESTNLNGSNATSKDTPDQQQSRQGYHQTDSHPGQPDLLSDSHLIPAIASFFERLHPIMPIFTRSWILDRIDKDEHRTQSSLAGMLLALSSLAKIQSVKVADRISRSQRNEQAKALLEQSVQRRSNALLGRVHSLDEVLASFYSFATLFGMQEHDAATFRLREAITLALLMKLNVHESYMFLDHGEQERRLRTYWLLCITERAYALQRGDSIALRGQPVTDMAFVAAGLPSKTLADFPHKQLRLFNSVDEAFVDCWHGRCARSSCQTFTRDRARLLHASFGAIYPDQIDANIFSGKKISLWQREMIQNIDTTITSHWLQSRLWQICLSHELLSPSSQDLIFRPAFVLQCAYQAHQFHVAADASSRDAHGVGLVEKLFDIGMALLQARSLSSIDATLRSNIDAILSLYIADLNNSSEEGRTFGDRLKADWQALGSAQSATG